MKTLFSVPCSRSDWNINVDSRRSYIVYQRARQPLPLRLAPSPSLSAQELQGRRLRRLLLSRSSVFTYRVDSGRLCVVRRIFGVDSGISVLFRRGSRFVMWILMLKTWNKNRVAGVFGLHMGNDG